MKSGPDRRYTAEFRQAAVRQVLDGGRSMPSVARSLEMSPKTLANWVVRARKGQQRPSSTVSFTGWLTRSRAARATAEGMRTPRLFPQALISSTASLMIPSDV